MTTRTVTVADNCATTLTPDGPRVAAGDSAECRIVRETLSQLGDKWTLLVILCLSAGPLRFNALQRAVVGISHRMLTVTLRKLERDGLVARTVYDEVPPHTEYALTALGVSFTEPVMAIANWAVAAQPQIEQNRERFTGVPSFD
ncbi:MAG: winged helix-turn-helix transcriptional regulator [Mycobacterium sp.]